MATNYDLPSYQSRREIPPFDPNAVMDGSPIYRGYQIGAQDPSMVFNPDLSSNDPNRIFRNSQNVSYNLGAGINADLYNQGQQQKDLYRATESR
jgi:hypothetical protein